MSVVAAEHANLTLQQVCVLFGFSIFRNALSFFISSYHLYAPEEMCNSMSVVASQHASLTLQQVCLLLGFSISRNAHYVNILLSFSC
jgi:hypothetical protein